MIEHIFDTVWSQVDEIALTAIEYAIDEDLAHFDNQTLLAEYQKLRRVIHQLEAQASRRLAEIDRHQAYAADGYRSTTAYVKHRCRTTGGGAKRQVYVARAPAAMERTRDFFENGRLSSDQVRRLFAARQSQPGHFEQHEETLCEVAEGLGWITDMDKALAYWGQAVAVSPTSLSEDDQRSRSYAQFSTTFEGMVEVDALLDAATGAEVIAKVREATPPPPGPDEPPASLANRQAQALADLIARDRHCRFPGCDRPPQWCDTHHITHWSLAGGTAVQSCILLCRRHHTLIHQRHFTIEGLGHAPISRWRDGTMLASEVELLDSG